MGNLCRERTETEVLSFYMKHLTQTRRFHELKLIKKRHESAQEMTMKREHEVGSLIHCRENFSRYKRRVRDLHAN